MRSRSVLMALAFTVGVFVIRSACAGNDKKPTDISAISALIVQGDAFVAKEDYAHALKAYASAEKLSHGTCALCLLREGGIEHSIDNGEKALDEAQRAAKICGNDKDVCAQAHLFCGVLLTEKASDSKDKHLAQAVNELQEAVTLNPLVGEAHFDLGYALMKQGRDAEGAAEFNTYLASKDPAASLVRKAHYYIADPERARELVAPDFDLQTADGREISNDSLHGRVVVLDFWATWCPPCRDAVPDLAYLRRQYAGEPVEIVSISLDRNHAAWTQFVAKHHMDGDQFIDSTGDLGHRFGIRTIPTYFVLDRDGIIRATSDSVDAMKRGLQAALKERPMPPVSSASGPGPRNTP
ncbi:MAG: redoxin domain-containing protein [Candidatus Acidiferrales bacterium]